jgi:hypothetical protein
MAGTSMEHETAGILCGVCPALGHELVDAPQDGPGDAAVLPTVANDEVAPGLHGDSSSGGESMVAADRVVLLAGAAMQELCALEADAGLRMRPEPHEPFLGVVPPAAPAGRLAPGLIDGDGMRAHLKTSFNCATVGDPARPSGVE